MSDSDPVPWELLDDEVREVMGWARACETGEDVGTRAMLIGVVRRAPGQNPVEDLLEHFGVRVNELFEVLSRGQPPTIPGVRDAERLAGWPILTPNGAQCLMAAEALRRRRQDHLITVPCLVVALLHTGRGTAARGLAEVLPPEASARFGNVVDAFDQWLDGEVGSLGAALVQTVPWDARRGEPLSKPAQFDAENPIWPFLAVIHRRRQGDDESHPVALGFYDSPRTCLVTTSVLSTVETATVLSDGAVRRLGQISEVGGVSAVSLVPPMGNAWYFPEYRSPVDGERCRVAEINDAGAISMIEGRVILRHGPDVEFAVDLELGSTLGSSAHGSPVVASDDRIVGVISESRSGPPVLRALSPRSIAAAVAAVQRGNGHDAPVAAPQTGTLSGAGNDTVGQEDQLGFSPYVEAFAELFMSPAALPPLTVGIFGSWGMGKSFLLRNIEREIVAKQTDRDEASDSPRVHVVHFNAWEYAATDVVWPGLARTIVKKLDKLKTWPWRKRLWARVRWNVTRQWPRLSTAIITFAIGVVAAIVLAVLKDATNVAIAIASVTAALGIGGLVKAATDPMAQWLTGLFSDSDYGRHLGVMEDIKHDLEMLEQRLHDKDGMVTDRILVLIDDLDRCEPAKAVEVLQAVNLLLSFDSFIVCLGIDARIITGAIESHYGELLGDAGASGYEYLDKIVQIPFRIPEPTTEELIRFVGLQLGNPSAPIEGAEQPQAVREVDEGSGPATTNISAKASEPLGDETAGLPARPTAGTPPEVSFTYEEMQAFESLAVYLRRNPRHLKRLVNVYRLVRTLARLRGQPLVAEKPAATIRWLVMWSQWPYTAAEMMSRYDSMVTQGSGYEDRSNPLGDLFEDVAKMWGESEVRERLDDPRSRLGALLEDADERFTWDEIALIRPYTVNFNPAVEELHA